MYQFKISGRLTRLASPYSSPPDRLGRRENLTAVSEAAAPLPAKRRPSDGRNSN